MVWWQALLYFLAVILILYLGGFFYVLSRLLSLRRQRQSRVAALAVIFEEKKDLLLSMYALVEASGLPLEGTLEQSAAKARWLKTPILKECELEGKNAVLADFERRLALLNVPNLKSQEDYQALSAAVQDLDVSYRRIVAVYDSEVADHEYWRKAPLYFPWLWLLGFRAKKRLP